MDGHLLKAMWATALWGGTGGAGPAFVITSDLGRGVGKSRLAALTGYLVGGSLDFSAKEDIATIKQRLLSPDALTHRVAFLDNVKSLRFSWAELGALVTSVEISGKRMFVGEVQRPNTFTWFGTLNGASLSTDMAQRCVIIKLGRPEYSGTFFGDRC